MALILGILVTLFLTAAAYIYLVKYYFSGCEIHLTKEVILALDLKRVVYIAISILAGIGLCLAYNLIYSGALITTQIKLITLVMLLIPIAVIDYRQYIIPDIILIAGLALRIIFYIIEFGKEGISTLNTLKYDLIAALVVILFFVVCMLLIKNSIGMGDVKLFGLIALYQGLWGVMSSVLFSLFVAFILSVVLMAVKKRGRKDSIPFGPSIFLGTYITIILTGI